MRYELLKNNLELIKEFAKKGILSPIWIRDLHIFEEYQLLYKQAQKKCKSCIHANLAIKYNISPLAVANIIKKVA